VLGVVWALGGGLLVLEKESSGGGNRDGACGRLYFSAEGFPHEVGIINNWS